MDNGLSRQASNSLTQRVAEEIRALLARRQLKQSQLARELQVNEQWISVRLRGVQPIGLDDLERISKVLGVSVYDLLPRESEGRNVVTAGQPGARQVLPLNDRYRDQALRMSPETSAHQRNHPSGGAGTGPSRNNRRPARITRAKAAMAA